MVLGVPVYCNFTRMFRNNLRWKKIFEIAFFSSLILIPVQLPAPIILAASIMVLLISY